jgi:hypothetical protein
MKVERIPAFDVTVKRLRVPDAWARYVGVTKGLKSVGYQPRCRGGSSPRSASGPLRYDRQLGQGDPPGHASIHEPAGRGHSQIIPATPRLATTPRPDVVSTP